MPEQIPYDDDPSDTAALHWLSTRLGLAMLQRAKEAPYAALRCAFRAGYLIGQRKAAEEAKEEPNG